MTVELSQVRGFVPTKPVKFFRMRALKRLKNHKRIRVSGKRRTFLKLAFLCYVTSCIPILLRSDIQVESSFVQFAKKVSIGFPYIHLMFLNHAYLNLTKSWICNIRMVGSDIFHQTIFVVSDEATAQELRNFEPRVFAYVHLSDTNDLSYGTFEYFSLTLERLKLQNELIQAGINIFLIEADAVWFSTLSEYFSDAIEVDGVSIISATDRSSKNPLISAGFIYFSASLSHFFNEYTKKYARIVSNFSGQKGRLDHIHAGEQHLMTSMLRKAQKNVTWLDDCHFARGEWYQDVSYRIRCPHPKVIQNNYIIGNSDKVVRAEEWNHWFLSPDGTCTETMPLVNPRGDFNVECAFTSFSTGSIGDTHKEFTVPHLSLLISLVNQTFYLVKNPEECGKLGSTVTCVVGTLLDRCLFTRHEREQLNYAELVTAVHGYVHQYAYYKNFERIAVIEKDIVLDSSATRNVLKNFQHLQRFVEANDWNVIRFGYLPYFLQSKGFTMECPSQCICTRQPAHYLNLCQMRHSQCDMRSSEFYVSNRRIFLKLAELVNDDTDYPCQAPRNRKVGVPMVTQRRIIDTDVLPFMSNQWYVFPQISSQKELHHLSGLHNTIQPVSSKVAQHYQRSLHSRFRELCILDERSE